MNPLSDTQQNLIYSLFRDMIKYRINYGYRGYFTQAVSDALIAFAQSIFSISGASMKTRKRAFYILVECIQNITRHQEIPDQSDLLKDGIFLIQSASGMYNISQGNIILEEQKAPLAEKLELINSLNQEELTLYYKSKLRSTSLSEKGGAGLGLIEIARKSGNQIDYAFKSLKKGFSYFFMDTLISDPSVPKPAKIPDFYGIKITEKLMEVLGDNRINLVYCSQFAGDSAFDVLDIVENLKLSKDQKSLVRKRSFNVLFELIQNIANHGEDQEGMDGKTGILLMGTEGKTNRIITGNIIQSKNKQNLNDYLEFLNDQNKESLEKLFINQLTDDNLKKGMGLIDVRMKSGHPFIYHFLPLDDKYTFFSIQVHIDNQED